MNPDLPPPHHPLYDTDPNLPTIHTDDLLLDQVQSGWVPGGLYRGHPSWAVASVLAGWRREIDTQPIPELVDPGTAVVVVRGARHRKPPPSHPVRWFLRRILTRAR